MSDDIAVRTATDIQVAESHAMALQALDAIADVKTPGDAEALLARVKVAAEAARVMNLGKEQSREWRGVALKAERRWGELLGAADRSANAAGHRPRKDDESNAVTVGHSIPSPVERKAIKEARKLSNVDEPVFEEYVENTEQPTKAGLLHAAQTPEPQEADLVPFVEPEMTTRQIHVANAARDRTEQTLHRLDGMCAALANVDPARATLTATEEQITAWLATAAQVRSNLQQFTRLIQGAS